MAKPKRRVIPKGWASLAEKLVMGYARRRVGGADVQTAGREAIDDLLQSRLGFRPLADVDDFQKWLEDREAEETASRPRAARPPRERKKPWWVVLGVSRDATMRQVKKARNELLLRYHPDRGAGNADKAADINAAFEEAKKWFQFCEVEEDT